MKSDWMSHLQVRTRVCRILAIRNLPECGGLTSRVGDELFQSVLTPRQVYWLIGLLLAVTLLVACAEEVAQAVASVIANDFMNGVVLKVNGGLTI